MSNFRVLPQKDQFERRADELEAQGKLGKPQPGAPEPQTGPWSKSNQLGSAKTLADLTVTNPSSKSLTFSGTILKLPEWGFPEVWTISLGLLVPPDFTGFVVGTATIVFGVGGSQQTIVCDWIQGTQLSLVMNAVEVNLSVTVQSTIGTETLQNQVQFSVQVSRGTRGEGPPPVRFISTGSIATLSDTGFIALPAFTKRVLVVPANVTSNAAIGNFYTDDARLVLFPNSAGGLITPRSAIRLSDLNRNQPGLDVINGQRFMAIINDSANTITYAAYAELAA